MICQQCGKEISGNTRFCPGCGKMLERQEKIIAESEQKKQAQINAERNRQNNQNIPYKYCQKCGTKIPQEAKFCSACGFDFMPKDEKTVQPVLNENGEMKDSTLSIIAAILSVFTITALAGVIVGVIDINEPDERYRHLGSKFAIVWGALGMIASFILNCILISKIMYFMS